MNLLSHYGQIFFSTHWYVGIFFLAATFIVPSQGVAGLVAMILANVLAKIFNLSLKRREEGYFAYNGMLVGLALSMVYVVNLKFIPIFIGAIFLSVFISEATADLADRHLGIPALSLPFVLTSWIALRAASRFPGLTIATSPFEVTMLNNYFHPAIDYFLRSIGAAFFSFNVPAGLLVFIGLFIFSRQALLLAVTGVFTVALTQHCLGFSFYPPDGGWLGFNSVLTAIALGGIFIAPGPQTFILAASGAFICALVTSAAVATLPVLGLPVLAFPFVVTTSTILYCLKRRVENRPFTVLQTQGASPEENSRQFVNMQLRHLSTVYPAFFPPVKGPWTITQGFNGEETHMGAWSHAWDFEVTDKEGKNYEGSGLIPEDFYAYNLPVYAPASGQVITVLDNLPDNSIGHVNSYENWGNLIIIAHRGGVYSLLCHLAKDSVKVKAGDSVQAGEVLAKVGSSGRSPVPHLHFQAQLTPEPGAPTIPVELLHYTLIGEKKSQYKTRGIPVTGDIIQSLIPDKALALGASFPLGQTWKYEVKMGEEVFDEEWKSIIDFSGNRFLSSSTQSNSLKIIVDEHSLITGPYQGYPESALKWFSLAVPRMPFTTKSTHWEDRLGPELLLAGLWRSLNNVVEPYFSVAGIVTRSKFVSCQSSTIETVITGEGLLKSVEPITITSTFKKELGLTKLVARTSSHQLCTMRLLS